MRSIKRIGLIVLLFVTYSQAQIMVISQNKVVFNKMKEYHELSEKFWNPVFDKLVDEGKLDEVGTLGHAWGDEWNVVGYYKAKDIASFEIAWSEGYQEYAKKTPQNVQNKIQAMIIEHKDSIYQLSTRTLDKKIILYYFSFPKGPVFRALFLCFVLLTHKIYCSYI